MIKYTTLIVLLSVALKCNGHLKIGSILSDAHKHVHQTVDGVAGAIFGGFGLGHRNTKPPPPPQETIVVVVEDHNNNRPYGYGQNDQQRPGHGQWNGNYNGNQHHPYSNGQNYGRPGYNHNNYGQNNYNRPDQSTQGYNQGNGGYYNHNHNHNNNDYNYNHNQGNSDYEQGNQYYQPTTTTERPQGQYNPPNPWNTTPKPETKPTYGSVHEIHTENPASDKTTSKDEPLFVPLNPNEYVYGGDKITISGPKRETDDKKAESNDDEDSPIDIRFQNQ